MNELRWVGGSWTILQVNHRLQRYINYGDIYTILFISLCDEFMIAN